MQGIRLGPRYGGPLVSRYVSLLWSLCFVCSQWAAGGIALEISEEHASEFDSIAERLKSIAPLAVVTRVRDATRQKLMHLLISIPGERAQYRFIAKRLAIASFACFAVASLVLFARVGGHPEWRDVVARSIGQ